MYTSHGHQIPGTVVEGTRPVSVHRCGGISMCAQCAMESKDAPRETHTEQTLFTVRDALVKSGLTERQTYNAITELQNAGILFRERL